MHSNTDSTPRRLLLADDDNEVRLGVADMIGRMGIEVIEADEIESALEVERNGEVHAAILDMYMPGGTGLDLLPHLWKLHAGLPCIVYSGRWSPSMELDALQLGAHACLKKPVEPRRLRDEVLRAFGQDPQAN